MLPEMTAHEIANEIGVRQIQSRIYGEGETFVMVEGKTDQVLWEEFRSKDDCTVYPVNGKRRIVAALDVIETRENCGVAGIVDGDHWLIIAPDELCTQNLLYDKCFPDMETLLVCSDALQKLLRNRLLGLEIDEVHDFARNLRATAQRLASEFGYFRLLNFIEDYGISFKKLWKRYCHGDFIIVDSRKQEFNREDFSLKLKATSPKVAKRDLLSEVDQLKEQYQPGEIRMCQGHDFVAILAYLLPIQYEHVFQKELPEDKRATFESDALSASLRASYDSRYFKETSLYGCIRSWESENPCYKILAEDI